MIFIIILIILKVKNFIPSAEQLNSYLIFIDKYDLPIEEYKKVAKNINSNNYHVFTSINVIFSIIENILKYLKHLDYDIIKYFTLFKLIIVDWIIYNYEKLNKNRNNNFFKDYKLANDTIIIDNKSFIFHFQNYDKAMSTSMKLDTTHYTDCFLENIILIEILYFTNINFYNIINFK